MRKVISLYTGVGGLDLGFEAAGFETAVAVEIDPEAVATLRHNRDWPVLDRDIHTISSKELLKRAGLRAGEVDALIGGPPCQPFSKSGYWASGDTLRLDDPRAGTLGAYLRVLRDTLPKTFLLENVPGLAYQRKSEGLELIARTIRKVNRDRGTSYTLAVAKLNAADFGVPQIRERVFVIGACDGEEFSFPASTHVPADGGRLPLGQRPYSTAWDAIGDLENDDEPELRVRGKWADLLPSIPEGENYLWHTHRGGGLPLCGWRRALLELPPEARQGTSLVDDPGPAGPGDRAIPLEEPAPLGLRALPPADPTGRLLGARRSRLGAAPARQRRALSPGGDPRPVDAQPTPGRSSQPRFVSRSHGEATCA
jgi:DNA (cytosine-5)-methyltransferase 1